MNPNKIPKLKYLINIWREKSIEYGIGKIYIIINMNNEGFIQNLKNFNLSDSLLDFSSLKVTDIDFKVKDKNYYLYTYLIYKKKNYKNINIPIYSCSILEYDKFYKQTNSLSFYNYRPGY